MFTYDNNGIVLIEEISMNEQAQYLREHFTSFSDTREVKVDARIHGETISGASGFNFLAEITFRFNEARIIIKWISDRYCGENGSDIVIHNLQYTKNELTTKMIPLHKILHIMHSSEIYAFCFLNNDSYNNCLICLEYMKNLLKDPKYSFKISSLTNNNTNEQKQNKHVKISNFKNRFLGEYQCHTCGAIGKWYDMDIIVDEDLSFEFSASCKVCDRLEYEYGHIDTYQFERIIPQPSRQNQAPWVTKYYNYPCPYCGKYKVKPAKWDDKGFSAAFWGAFSYELHCNYKCDNCKKMWE